MRMCMCVYLFMCVSVSNTDRGAQHAHLLVELQKFKELYSRHEHHYCHDPAIHFVIERDGVEVDEAVCEVTSV